MSSKKLVTQPATHAHAHTRTRAQSRPRAMCSSGK